MANVNKCILIGNLTRDPEIKFAGNGTGIAKIGLAITRKWNSEAGPKEETCFADLTAFGKQAETIAQYCKKGHRLYVEGRLKLDQWDDKQTGQKRSKLGVVVESFQFLSKRDDSAPRAAAPAPAPEAPATDAPPMSPIDPVDDVPF